MVLSSTKAKVLMDAALDGRAMRQNMISGNIANINTPFYKSRDVDFESALIAKSKQMYGTGDTKVLQMAKTDDNHMSSYQNIDRFKPTVFLRDGHMAKNDGNTVDLDIETTELSKNSVMFTALTAALKRNSQIFRSVIEASKSIR